MYIGFPIGIPLRGTSRNCAELRGIVQNCAEITLPVLYNCKGLMGIIVNREKGGGRTSRLVLKISTKLKICNILE